MKKTLNFRIDKETYQQVKQLADKQKRSMSNMVLILVQKGLK